MEGKALLPIGSVVHIKESEKKMMIIGILQQSKGIRYDYLGVLYPEGYLDSEHVYLFNHCDLEDVNYLGYIDAEMQAFRGWINRQEIVET